MIQGYLHNKIPSAVIEFNPFVTAGNTPFLEIIKKIIADGDYILVRNKGSSIGIITLKNLIRIIASGFSAFSLRAKNITQEFPCQLKSEIPDLFTVANLIYQHNYPAYGLIDNKGNLESIITPRSLIKYLSQESIYQNIPIQELTYSNLIEVPSYLSIISVSKIMSEQNLTAIKFHLSGEIIPRIITIKDVVSLLLNYEWKSQTIKDISGEKSPSYLPSENVAVISKNLADNYGCLINDNNSANQIYNELFLSNKNNDNFKLFANSLIQSLDTSNISLITPENMLLLFNPSWQHNYLLKQQQKLHQLQTAIHLEKKQVEQEKLFSQLSYRIRQSLNLNEILSNTVQEVRQFLGCDRVIIYQHQPDGDGIIIAESVEPNILSVLGRIINDYCFAKDYVKPYLDGRIQAIENVFTANLSPCHLNLLLSIQVHANLVVPIIFHDKLWGLLAAQNCKTFRRWQDNELNLLEKLAVQVAIAIQQSEYSETANRIANYQSTIASIANEALATKEIGNLLQNTVKFIAKTLNIEYCDILELLPNQAAFCLKACVGWDTEWLEIAKMGASPRWMPGYTLKALQPIVSEDLMIETRFSPSPFLQNKGLVSGVCVNIGATENYYGVLCIYSKNTRKFTIEEINFLQTVANVLATAIEKNKSQEQLNCFFDLSLDMFCIMGIDGSFKRVNSSFLTTLGYNDKDLLTHNLIDFVHQDDKKITLKELEKLSQGFPSINFENRWRCKDGNYRWLAWKNLPSEEGTIYGVARDITLAKQAQEELKILNEKLELRVKDRTEELEQTTTQLRTFVQTAGTVLIVLNQEYRILEWNEEAEKIFGWTRDSVLGEDYFLLFIPPSQREKLRQILNQTIHNGKICRNLECKIITYEGNERCLIWNINRFVDNNGQGIGVIACGQDIEEVRMAQLRLKLSEERFRSIFNQAAVGIIQVSLPGKLVLVNDKFTQLLGYPSEKLTELDFHQLINSDDISETLSDLSELLAGNKATFEREIRMQQYTGETLWVNLTMSVVWVSIEPSYFIAVINDISDRKRVEESLQKSEARLNSILNSLQDVVWSISLPEMKLRYINPASKIIYGKSPEDLIANPNLLQEIAKGEDRKKVEEIWKNIINNSLQRKIESDREKNWELEYKIELPSGEIRWIRDRVHLVYDRYGRAISIDGISTDVTQRHQAEEKLFKSLQEKEVLLKEVHHRVKNNLYVISGLLNLQSSYIKDEGVRNLFQDSQHRIQTMAVIHEQLYQSDDLSEIDFADYLKRLISNLFLSYNHQQSGIKAITHLEQCYLHIETAIPAGLLINELVTNAFKHAFPNGKGEIKINLQITENHTINLTVMDNGKGLPSDLNWQESPSLGLRLVRLLSQQLEAEVTVKTSKQGTSFSLEFIEPNLVRSIQ